MMETWAPMSVRYILPDLVSRMVSRQQSGESGGLVAATNRSCCGISLPVAGLSSILHCGAKVVVEVAKIPDPVPVIPGRLVDGWCQLVAEAAG